SRTYPQCDDDRPANGSLDRRPGYDARTPDEAPAGSPPEPPPWLMASTRNTPSWQSASGRPCVAARTRPGRSARERVLRDRNLGGHGFCSLVLGWHLHAAEIGGIALSTTSVAVVYAVMVETGLNRHDLGKLILAACFITDLGTVLALGGFFAS